MTSLPKMGDYTMEQERLRREREEAMRKAGKVVGEEIVEIGASTKEELKRCFVFASRNISKKKLDEMLEEFQASNPGYEPPGYHQYKDMIKGE
ncbi:hypothetical protein [uncultured Oscillibacter sp.]|uniref:hypothetical protein n=1 Tax=uncultured Oscillibacter sp. TaxID=876091 RepID=UPI00262FF30F|nr:hypothetical protein [uncultured Oscillibacter sp.]